MIDSVPTDSVETENHKSAVAPGNRDSVERQIQEELDNGQYKIVPGRPFIVSALGAVPKKGSAKVRLIHDASRPLGLALNNFASDNPVKYQTIQDAVKLIKPRSFMAKIDLSNAYRVVKINPSNWQYTGLKWTFKGHDRPTFMVDTRLPFGAKKSPMIFTELTQAVRRIMAAKGFRNVVVYLDDFLIVEESYEQCRACMDVLFCVLRELGFRINYRKVEGPTQRITFLGVVLDSISMNMYLPAERCDELMACLCDVKVKSKVTKKQLQSLAGKLNWASLCIYGGRPHLRRIINRINSLKQAHHRTRVTKDMHADLDWWIQFMGLFNGSVHMVDDRSATAVSIDACTEASGGFYHGSFVYTPWSEAGRDVQQLPINYKEVLALEPAVQCWAPWWKDRKVYVHSDNQAAVSIINRGTCKHPLVMDSLRRVFWLSATFNFKLQAVYYPGKLNTLADCVSRLHEPGAWSRLQNAMWGAFV